MKHPKTTWAGILLIVGAIVNLVSGVLQGHPLDMNALGGLFTPVLAGIALMNAHDGSV